MQTHADDRGATNRDHINHVASLLRAYPDLPESEIEEIARFLRSAPILDQGMLSSQPDMPQRITRFRKEQRSFFTWTAKEVVTVVGILAILCATIVMLWDSAVR